MSGSVSVVIPSFNGRDVLGRCLPSVLDEARRAEVREVLVVDDASTDDSVRWLGATYPEVRVLTSPANRGFGQTANRGVREARGDLVLLLNSDIRVAAGLVARMVPHFDDPEVFAVTARTRTADDRADDFGLTRGIFRQGELTFLGARQIRLDRIEAACDTFYAGGGQSMFRKSLFLELGGFDPLFRPFYYEDADLSYRARKRGLRIVYEPAAVCFHEGQATIRRAASRRRIRLALERNYLLFSWANVTDPPLVREMRRMAPLHFLKALVTGNWPRAMAYPAALLRLPAVLARRRGLVAVRTDAELLDLSFRGLFRY